MALSSSRTAAETTLHELMRSLRQDTDHADLEIGCATNHCFGGHCSIICKQSSVLQSMVTGGEPRKRLILIHHPAYVHRLIEYLYEHDYSDTTPYDKETLQQGDDLWWSCEGVVLPKDAVQKFHLEVIYENGALNLCHLHASMYAVAQTYGIESLKKCSSAKFTAACEKDITQALTVEVLNAVFTNDASQLELRKALWNALAPRLESLEPAFFSGALKLSPLFAERCAEMMQRRLRNQALAKLEKQHDSAASTPTLNKVSAVPSQPTSPSPQAPLKLGNHIVTTKAVKSLRTVSKAAFCYSCNRQFVHEDALRNHCKDIHSD